MAELQAALNTLAGTTGLDAQRAANVWAGTQGTPTYSPTGNLLTANQASVETGATTGWTIQNAELSALVASTDYAAVGIYSLKGTSIGTSVTRSSGATPTNLIPGQTYTSYALARSNQVSGETARVDITWFTAASAFISTSSGTAVTLTNTEWSVLITTAIAPAGADWARIDLNRVAGANGAITYWDKIGFWQGSGGSWAPPGQNILLSMSGELDMVDALNVRAGFTPGNYLALQGVLNKLAGTTGRDTNAAAEALLAGRLSAANSGFESGVGDWGVNANCTRAQSSAQAYTGTNSLALTSLAAGDMSVQILPVTLGVPVTPGQMLDASARVRAATTGRGTGISIAWWTSVGGWISTTGGTTFPTDTTSGWVQPTCVRAVAPATAAYATPVVVILSAGAAGEVHYVDNVIVR